MWATSVIFKKLPKVNNHLLGENSPNLVTLIMVLNWAKAINDYLEVPTYFSQEKKFYIFHNYTP
jgi:hypothetical protein